MTDFNRTLMVTDIRIYRAFWDFEEFNIENIDTEQEISFGILAVDKDDRKKFNSEAEIKLIVKEKLLFACNAKVMFKSLQFDIDEISSDPAKKDLVNKIAVELTLGHVRNLLMHATTLSGHGTPLILSAMSGNTIEPA